MWTGSQRYKERDQDLKFWHRFTPNPSILIRNVALAPDSDTKLITEN